MFFFFFFFSSRRRHTRLQGDWSSDVCSSDLAHRAGEDGLPRARHRPGRGAQVQGRSEEHTSELQSPCNLVCRLLLEKKKKHHYRDTFHLLLYCIQPPAVCTHLSHYRLVHLRR